MAVLFCALNSFGQNNLKFSPEKPQAGDVITISYSSSGILPQESIAYTLGSKGQTAEELDLKKSGDSFTGSIKTDTAASFVYLSFAANKNFDNNLNNGYWIQLYDGDKLKKGANSNAALFYQYYGESAGVEANNEKALSFMDAELKLYPETKSANIISYLRLYGQVKKDELPAMIQKEIEAALKAGLKDENDYSNLQNMYALAKLPQQGLLINNLKKEKFPKGKWTIGETMQKFSAEKDLAKKEQMLEEISSKIKNDPDWKYLESSLDYYKASIPSAYLAKKDWEGAKNAVKKYDIKGAELAQLYNSAAWKTQESGQNLKEAEEISAEATDWAKNEWKKPTGQKPAYLTKKQWDDSRANTYAMYADTYAMINFKLENYKKGLSYAEDAALKIAKGENADENNTYALLAEKALSPKKYVPQLEKFMKDGKSTSGIKEILKRAYVKEHKSETGYDDYIAKLEKDSYLKMAEELRKGMLKDEAPVFTLVDLKGNKVNMADLKNKVVVVDFWATWCGPCKASFPGMQKMVTKYKDDADVKFVFVDTWETHDNKEKNAGDFISANKYDFHVLMDNDNKVVEQFKVSGIPTKFVIDKKGTIRFKSIGFSGSDDALVSELSTMIDMAREM